MGIIKAGMSALHGAAKDQWKEAFCAGEMGSDLIMVYGTRMTGAGSANRGSSNVITAGSLITVGEGECAIATEGGKIVGVYDNPGEHVFESDASRGIFSGGLGAFAKDVGRRITFGGDVAITQRLTYINTKELTGGSILAEGIPIRWRDPKTGLDMDGCLVCSGSYTFRIADPALFYKAAVRSTAERSRQNLLRQMDAEVLTVLPVAIAKMTENGIRPNELLQYTETLCETLESLMSERWSGLRGIKVVSMAFESLRVLDMAAFRELQKTAVLQDRTMAAGYTVGAVADALPKAAENPAGAAALVAAITARPCEGQSGWQCGCGARSSGKFCPECGAKKPEAGRKRCAGCGYTAPEGGRQPKFCPECGKPFQ